MKIHHGMGYRGYRGVPYGKHPIFLRMFNLPCVIGGCLMGFYGDVMGYVNDVANKKQHSDSFQEVDDRRGGFNDLYNGTVPNSMSMWIH